MCHLFVTFDLSLVCHFSFYMIITIQNATHRQNNFLSLVTFLSPFVTCHLSLFVTCHLSPFDLSLVTFCHQKFDLKLWIPRSARGASLHILMNCVSAIHQPGLLVADKQIRLKCRMLCTSSTATMAHVAMFICCLMCGASSPIVWSGRRSF